VHIDRNSTEKYKPEYDVLVRRFAETFAQTSPGKEAMGAAISVFEPGETIREHVNKPDVEEVFLVLDGDVDFYLDGRRERITTGDMGLAHIGQAHAFTNAGTSTARLLSIWWRAVREPAPVA
jgi:quercetin dioxygenase-like cupin family protein